MQNARSARIHKSLLKIGLAAVLVMLLAGCGAAAAAGSWNGDVFTPNASGYTTAAELVTDLNGGNLAGVNASCSGNTVILLKDIKLGNTLKLGGTTKENTITLDLNGTVLSRNSGTLIDFPVITVDSGKYLNLTTESNTTVVHYFKFVDNGPWTLETSKPTDNNKIHPLSEFNRTEAIKAETDGYYINVTGGVITGGNVGNLYGGGVFVNGGTFTMEGGNIIGNKETNGISTGAASGGVYVTNNNAKFTMDDGSIAGNSASSSGGGGVMINYGGSFTMNGGNIVGNTATQRGGGGVDAWSGEFNMTGGNITGNHATQDGGGVYVNTGACTFEMSGTASIKGNSATKNGGGVFTVKATNHYEFTMRGGSITGNSAGTNGGGVYVDILGPFNVSGTLVIKDNKKTSDGTANNVYLPSGKTITVTGVLQPGAKIWVTTETDPSETTQVAVTGTNTDDYSANFESDKATYYVANTGTESSQVVKLFVGKKVTYNGNGNTGGDVPVDSKSYKPGAEVTVLGNTGSLAKTGYTFSGWNVGSTSGELKTAGEQFTITEDTVLYAKWTENPQPPHPPSHSSGASSWMPASPADTQGTQITYTVTAQYAGHTFVGISAGDVSDLRTVSPEIAAAAEIKISTAKAAGIKVTNSKGAPALILTKTAKGLDTVTFCGVYDIKPTNPDEKLTQVTVTVPKADVAASGLTTDDVTIYHFLDAYDIWVPLDTLQITEDAANYYYTAATDGVSPFGVLIKKFDAAPVSPVSSQTTSPVSQQATSSVPPQTTAPVSQQTTSSVPPQTTVPVSQQTTSASPVPVAGIIAGLGAAGVLFVLRRK